MDERERELLIVDTNAEWKAALQENNPLLAEAHRAKATCFEKLLLGSLPALPHSFSGAKD